ncbi:MAG: ATP-binding protein [Chloroflexota bacterium]|nr:ATP-binding protein [Chloroflexota bacterium]
MRELALHILDIAENSISANADKIRISIYENISEDILRIVIEDNRNGMDQELLQSVIDPFVTSRTTRKVGLGIPFFKSAAEACDGTFKILSHIDSGTIVEASFKHSHIDRMPLGNIIGAPEVHWLFEYQNGKERFIFDDEPI